MFDLTNCDGKKVPALNDSPPPPPPRPLWFAPPPQAPSSMDSIWGRLENVYKNDTYTWVQSVARTTDSSIVPSTPPLQTVDSHSRDQLMALTLPPLRPVALRGRSRSPGRFPLEDEDKYRSRTPLGRVPDGSRSRSRSPVQLPEIQSLFGDLFPHHDDWQRSYEATPQLTPGGLSESSREFSPLTPQGPPNASPFRPMTVSSDKGHSRPRRVQSTYLRGRQIWEPIYPPHEEWAYRRANDFRPATAHSSGFANDFRPATPHSSGFMRYYKSSRDENSQWTNATPTFQDRSAGQAQRPLPMNKFPCPLAERFNCSARFTTSGHASRHAKGHTGEKPAQCPECGKRFTRKDNMEQHRRTHQGRPERRGSRARTRTADPDAATFQATAPDALPRVPHPPDAATFHAAAPDALPRIPLPPGSHPDAATFQATAPDALPRGFGFHRQ